MDILTSGDVDFHEETLRSSSRGRSLFIVFSTYSAFFMNFIALFYVVTINAASFLAYAYFLSLGLLVCVLLGLKNRANSFICAFGVSVFFTLYMYHYFMVCEPAFEGMRPGGDTAFFYENLLAFLDANVGEVSIHYFGYVAFQGFLMYPISLVKEISILDALFLNAMGHALCAAFAYDLASSIRHISSRGAKVAFYSSLFCGMTIYQGLTFMRDGWVATFMVIVIWAFYKKRIFVALSALFLLALVRTGSFLAAMIALIVATLLYGFPSSLLDSERGNPSYLIFLSSKKRLPLAQSMPAEKDMRCIRCSPRKGTLGRVATGERVWLLAVVLLVLLLFAKPIMSYLAMKNVSFLEGSRVSFFTHIELSSKDDAVLMYLIKFPPLVRSPILFLYYLFAPYFRLLYFSLEPQRILAGVNTLWIAFFMPSIVRGIFVAWRGKNRLMKSYFVMYCFCVMSMLYSLQMRHKTLAFPLICCKIEMTKVAS